MKMSFKKIDGIIIAFLILASININAQKGGLFSKKNVVNQYSTIGIGGGSSHYFGDLAPYSYAYYGIYTNVRWNAGLNYTRFLTDKIAGRVSFTYIRLFGDDFSFSNRNIEKLSNQALRNLHFRNDLQEFVISGVYNLAPQYGKGAKGRSVFMPYVTAGIGIYGHNPKAIYRDQLNESYATKAERKNWIALRSLNTAGQGIPATGLKPYSLVQLVAPISAGVRIKINQNFDITAEAGLRITPFDYLDDVGATGYPDPSLLTDPYMSYRANEDFRAFTGEPRIFQFLSAATVAGMVTGSGTSPQLNANDIYSVSSSLRGTSRKDSYIITQIKLNYVLSNRIKCPVIR